MQPLHQPQQLLIAESPLQMLITTFWRPHGDTTSPQGVSQALSVMPESP